MAVGLALGFAALLAALWTQEPPRDEVLVFAAASLADVSDALAEQFEAAYPGVDVLVSLGASSTLARQIESGAPADVFLSASPEWTAYLAERNLLRAPSRPVVSNRLVVVGPTGAQRLASLDDLAALYDIAVADPTSVPAGQYARAGLERAGLWEAIETRLIPTVDARAAVAAVQTGGANAAIVYATDALGADGVSVFLDWPDAYAPPVRYTVAVPRTTPNPSRAFEFAEFVRHPDRETTWRRFGFAPLAETVSP